MQELIQRLKSVDENHRNAGLRLAIQIGNELLEKEKEQILNAYSEGADGEYEYHVNMVGNRTDIDCEKYYNETFKKQNNMTTEEKGLNLNDLQAKIEDALSKETTESLNEWINSKRQDDVDKLADIFLKEELQIASPSVNRAIKLGFTEGYNKAKEILYTEEEVKELLKIQRGNSYVAILTKTYDKELATIASTAPEPMGKDGWVK